MLERIDDYYCFLEINWNSILKNGLENWKKLLQVVSLKKIHYPYKKVNA